MSKRPEIYSKVADHRMAKFVARRASCFRTNQWLHSKAVHASRQQADADSASDRNHRVSFFHVRRRAERGEIILHFPDCTSTTLR